MSFLQRKWIFSWKQTREQGVIVFFAILVLILVGRLFFLQVVKWADYRKALTVKHTSEVDINAKRGGIFAYDDAWQAIALATNADLYTLFVDPKYVRDIERIDQIITPILYEHFCKMNSLWEPTKEQCINNIETFTQTTILPKYQTIHYQTVSDASLTGQLEEQWAINIENDGISQQRQEIINAFSEEEAKNRISARLVTLLTPTIRTKNYVWFFDSTSLLDALSTSEIPSLSIVNTYYVYIEPENVKDADKEAEALLELLTAYWYNYSYSTIRSKFQRQTTRYVKITDSINARLAEKISLAISQNRSIQSSCKWKWSNCEPGIPLLHGLGLEKTERRYYPMWNFAANILWYVKPDWTALYGVEQYYDTLLKGEPGHVVGLSAPWIWEIGSNEISIINATNGYDVYLTINPYIQRKTENLIAHYLNEFKADSIAIFIMDPFSGNVIASANAPTFDPNIPQASYELKPLSPADAYIVDDDTYVDIPIYYVTTGNKLEIATYDERKTTTGNKYVAKNLLGPQVFVDKNIAYPYEPGSIIKPFTVAAALDSDEITLYDFYSDPDGEVKIDIGNGAFQYIRNADQGHCIWTNTYLHALIYSCNVGIVDIALQMKKEVFYNYMQKMWFGSLTNIELAGESAGSLDTAATAGTARFFNNSFGQGMLATPAQIAAWYSALVNGWYYIKPRIVERLYDPEAKKYIENPVKPGAQILKPEISEKMKDALFEVVHWWLTKNFGIQWYTLGGKTGTSQIAFKWQYRSWNWWTHGSFVGMVTRDDLKYIVVIQIRRPRTNQFWEYTAWKIFGDLSKILIEKNLILD